MAGSPVFKENRREMTMLQTSTAGRAPRRGCVVLLCLLAAIAAPALPSAAQAAIELESFTAGLSDTAAGAHPDVSFDVAVARDPATGVPAEQLRNLQVALPPGLIANARDTPVCSLEAFMTPNTSACPATTRVGGGNLWSVPSNWDPSDTNPTLVPYELRVFNLEPGPSQPARLGFQVKLDDFGMEPAAAIVDVAVRNGEDYGVTSTARGLVRLLPVIRMEFTLWGVPADHGIPVVRKPFMVNATACDGPATVSVSADSYQSPAELDSRDSALPALERCATVPFTPSIDVRPDTGTADSPTGLEVDLTIPQSDHPDERVSSALRDASFTLPDGMTLSPSAADGLQGCSDAQFGLTSPDAASCPAAAKIGTVTVDVPSLRAPLKGSVYVGSQQDHDPYRMFLLAEGLGVRLKLEGSVSADPQTGRLTVSFDGNPQVPFSKLSLALKGGPRAPLATPPTCGEKTVMTELVGWSGRVATPSDSFTVDCPGVTGFAPLFMAGTANPVGGSFSPFAMSMAREDRQQYLGGVSMELPNGLLAKRGGVPLCPDAAAAAGKCGAESRVGTATVGAGPGSQPFFLDGGVHLTGPYKGAPYGLAVAVRAIAGPYDLGTVVVRQALHVDPDDAHVTVVSDPLPQILEGIPLRLRSVRVDIDRPGFTVNPTSCDPMRIDGTLSSVGGAVVDIGSRFQVGDCVAMRFSPKLSLRLVGKSERAPGKHPGLRAVVTQPAGQANMSKVRVKLPSSLALDPDNARVLCSYEDGLKAACPAGSRIGTATANSPLLAKPLTGPVYLVQGVRFDKATGSRIRTLPTLLTTLRGEIAVDLRAKSSVAGKRLVSTFPAIPDAPVSRFSLRLRSGNGGILAVTGERNLCAGGAQTAAVETDGHNGRRADYVVRVRRPCAKTQRR
jgi:hypothetical protein